MESKRAQTSRGKSSAVFLSHEFTFKDKEDDIFCVKFSNNYLDDSSQPMKLACGCGDGTIRLFNFENFGLSKLLANPKVNEFDQMPITCLRWRNPQSEYRTKSILTAGSADGCIYYWHTETNKLVHTIKEENNQVYCMDYDKSCTFLATAGKDFLVRVYDEETKKLLQTLKGDADLHHGHSNRVFACKFHPTETCMLFTGGWDNSILAWDIRKESPAYHFLGPNISGESLDVYENKVIAGSFNNDKNLMIFDIRNTKSGYAINWFDSDEKSEEDSTPSCLYSATFTKPKAKYILAGGASKNEVRMFRNSICYDEIKSVSKISNIKTACLSLDCSNSGDLIAVGCADGTVMILRIND